MAYRWSIDDLNSLTGRVRAWEVPPALAKPKKPPKYRNVKVTDAEGNVHDSGKEYRHWCDLQLREVAGEIRNLRRQVPLACVVNDVLVCHYVADAMYEEGAATIVVDAKSPATRKLPAYRLKVKLVQALHKLQIREV